MTSKAGLTPENHRHLLVANLETRVADPKLRFVANAVVRSGRHLWSVPTVRDARFDLLQSRLHGDEDRLNAHEA